MTDVSETQQTPSRAQVLAQSLNETSIRIDTVEQEISFLEKERDNNTQAILILENASQPSDYTRPAMDPNLDPSQKEKKRYIQRTQDIIKMIERAKKEKEQLQQKYEALKKEAEALQQQTQQTPTIQPAESSHAQTVAWVAEGIPVELKYCTIQLTSGGPTKFPVLFMPQKKILDVYANKDFCWRPDTYYDEIPFVFLEEFQVSSTKAAQWLEILSRDKGDLTSLFNSFNETYKKASGSLTQDPRLNEEQKKAAQQILGDFAKQIYDQFNAIVYTTSKNVLSGPQTPTLASGAAETVPDPWEGVYTASEFFRDYCFQYCLPCLARSISIANNTDSGSPVFRDSSGEGGGQKFIEFQNPFGENGFVTNTINSAFDIMAGSLAEAFLNFIHNNSAVLANMSAFFNKNAGFTGYHPIRHFSSGSNQSFTLDFPLVNTLDFKRAVNNYKFIYIFMFQNLVTRTSSYSFLPPKYYKISIMSNLGNYLFGGPIQGIYLVSNFRVDPIGQIRKIGSTEGLGAEIILPEAWNVSITFTPLIDTSTNLLAQQFAPFSTNEKIRTSLVQGINIVRSDTPKKNP